MPYGPVIAVCLAGTDHPAFDMQLLREQIIASNRRRALCGGIRTGPVRTSDHWGTPRRSATAFPRRLKNPSPLEQTVELGELRLTHIFLAAQSLIGGNHHPQILIHKHSALCHGRAVCGFGNAGGFWPGRLRSSAKPRGRSWLPTSSRCWRRTSSYRCAGTSFCRPEVAFAGGRQHY